MSSKDTVWYTYEIVIKINAHQSTNLKIEYHQINRIFQKKSFLIFLKFDVVYNRFNLKLLSAAKFVKVTKSHFWKILTELAFFFQI